MSTTWWPVGERAEFISPATIVSGRGSSAGLANVLEKRLRLPSGADVFLAVDDVVHELGALAPMLTSVEAAGYRVTLVGGFGAEPDDAVVNGAAEVARRTGADVVIGVGGGSVMDAAKLIALLVRNDGEASDWVGLVDPPAGIAPLVLVPTTCGTGSEATRAAMVTIGGSKRICASAMFVPDAVVLDPSLIDGLPGHIVAATGMDALSHAVEAMLSTDRSPMSVHHARQAISLLIENLESAVARDADARAACLWAAHLSGQALNAGVLVGHSIAYCLAHEVHRPHGVLSGLAMPYVIAFNARGVPDECARALAEALTGGATDDLSAAAASVMDLLGRLGLPRTLDDLQVEPGAEQRLADQCVREYPRRNNPVAMTGESMRSVFETMRTGDLARLGVLDAVGSD